MGEPVIDRYEFEIGGSILPLTRIRTKEYKDVLEVITNLNQKFPASLLRKIKEHIYELVLTNDPTGKIAVVDFDTDTDLDKVDVVLGVGVGGRHEKSYETFTRFDIAEDVLFDNKEFEISELITKTLPKLVKAKSWIPVNKYYSQIENKESLDLKIRAAATREISEFKDANPYSYKEIAINEIYQNIEEVIAVNSPEKAVKIILLLHIDKINIDTLKVFLKQNFGLTTNTQQASYFMKLICLYDRLSYN